MQTLIAALPDEALRGVILALLLNGSAAIAPDVHQVIVDPVGEHSAKPEDVRARIERLLAGPHLELFARRKADGWTVWGNEVAVPMAAAE